MNYFNELRELQKKSYCPYSKYKVAAIAINEKGDFFCGVNIENASYGVGTCAERTAIANAIVNGSKKINEIHLICGNNNNFGSPCGACRQFMAEFMSDKAKIIIYNKKGEWKEYTLKELLPNCFRKTFFNKE